ncbi:hypothetical protein [Marinobacter sp.]|uniref:hypothetical protein n=1 Tax=Marinobacter sp. TaxID=50741 RepID=UPI003A941EFD
MTKKMSDPGLAATMLCASLMLSACGGGGGGGGGGDPGSSGSSGGNLSTLKAGLYTANVIYTNTTISKTATTYLSPTGQLAIVFGKSSGLSFGTLTFDSIKISGTSHDYRQVDPGSPDPKGFLEDKGIQEGTIKGTIISQGSATFSTSDPAGQVNTNVTLQRQNALSDLRLSLSRASGTYGSSDVTLDVNADGSVFSQYYTGATGCQLVGTESLSVPDPSINVFNIAYTMSNCFDVDRNGEYSGVGFFGPTKDQRMQMIFAAHNGKVAMKFEGIKQ